jgi:hypothetical protein
MSTNPSGSHVVAAKNSNGFDVETGLDGGVLPVDAPDTVPDSDLVPTVHSSPRVAIDPNVDSPPRGSLARSSLKEDAPVPCTSRPESSPGRHVSSSGVGRGSSVALPRALMPPDSLIRSDNIAPISVSSSTDSAPVHPSMHLQHGI